MRKRNVLSALVAAALVLQVAGTVGASAQAAELEFEFTPASGAPGQKISFTGTGCPHDPTKTQDGVFILSPDGTNGTTTPFQSNSSGEFQGQHDTTGAAARSYITLVRCDTNTKAALGDPYTVTAIPVTGATYHPLVPARVLDTRDGTGTAGGTNPIGQFSSIELKVTGTGGVPAEGVAAVAINVTATNASGPESYLTVYPTGSTRPLASNVNFRAGRAIPNLVIARVGPGGKISIYNNAGSVHAVGDVQGWYADSSAAVGSTFVPVNPLRILDTRDGTGSTQAKIPAGGTIELTASGQHGVPSGATAVVLNVTATDATGPESFMTVFPSGQTRPVVSNLNFTNGPPSANVVIARVGGNGKIAIYNNAGSTDVVADLNGWFAAPVASGTTPPGQVYFPVNPARALDTRDGTGTPGGLVGQLGTDNFIDLTVTGIGGVPVGATSVVLNVTVVDSPGPESYLTLFPAGTVRPLASNINFVAGQIVANLVIVRVVNGKVSIYNHVGSTHVIADVQGWFGANP